jgi:dolichyldiphosphatase
MFYPSNSLSQFIAAHLSLFPQLLFVALCAVAAARRELETINQMAMLLFSVALNVVLKRVIRQPRPVGSWKSGYGMPSDHAQFAAALTLYWLLWMHYSKRVRLVPPEFSQTVERRAKSVLSVVLVVAQFCVAWSRWALGVHSAAQLVVGTAVGWSVALLWHSLSTRFFWPTLFPRLLALDSVVMRLLLLRDSGRLPHPLHSECLLTQSLQQLQSPLQGANADTNGGPGDASSSKKYS